MKSSTKGFTLIELLVVIAIIGILSSVVLASLNSARTKGADASIKSNLANIRAQAELSYDNNSGSYANVCTDTTVINAINSAKSASGITAATGATTAAVTSSTAVCHASSTGWAVALPLKSNTAQYACVDFTGQSTTTHQLTASSGTCGL
jgi:prepilin-type N-terminal cleavage/methylation domain-containing protein